jgi:hypothetical protein
MQKLIVGLLLATATAANAECYQRKEILSVGGLPIDSQRESHVQLGKNHYKCTYSFRVLVDRTWTWAEKYGEANTAVKACMAARDSASTWMLDQIPEHNLSVQQSIETVCDTTKKSVSAVRLGQQVNLSDLTIDPKFVNADGSIRFVYPVDNQNLVCSIFLENQIRPDGLAVQYKGYVCQTGSTWTVWKKWEQSRIDK